MITAIVFRAPGSGKTFAAKILSETNNTKKRVGISSNSHKAILNLMSGVADYLLENQIEGELIKIGGAMNPFLKR